jgi:hypothetical protein
MRAAVCSVLLLICLLAPGCSSVVDISSKGSMRVQDSNGPGRDQSVTTYRPYTPQEVNAINVANMTSTEQSWAFYWYACVLTISAAVCVVAFLVCEVVSKYINKKTEGQGVDE